MRKKRVTTWFVEPLNGKTNESAMAELAAELGATDDKIYRRKKDNMGKRHNVVEVEYSFITLMENNAAKFQHRFCAFKQTEGESEMSRWFFGNQSNLSRTAEVKRVAGEIIKRKKPTKHTVPKRK